MKTLASRKILNTSSSSNKKYIQELCFQTPFLVINTSCGIGKYKFNKIGYDSNDDLILEYILINDRKYNDTPNIMYKLGKYYYLSAQQVLYAFKYFANT
ncbi:MAG: hypothetical protein CMG66_00145 [Candidatus Marinimicrobia bacterium]|nr:hypothetical protein [Candidatus Neomarinimicrobiota bacterium]